MVRKFHAGYFLLVRKLCLLFFFLIIGSSTTISAQELPVSAKPQATVVVKEEPTGTELVDITMLDPNFPKPVLQKVIEGIGLQLGVAPKGVYVFDDAFGKEANQKFVKARFGVSGLIDRSTGALNLQVLAKAFSGELAPNTIKTFSVVFDGEFPTARTLRSYSSDAVVVDGKFSSNPPSIEYLIALRTQETEKIEIPLRHVPPPVVPEQSSSSNAVPMNVLIAIIVIGSISAGLLVYFLLLGRSGKSSH